MSLKENTANAITAIVGAENVITNEETILSLDPVMLSAFQKAHGTYKPAFMPLCYVKIASTEMASKVLAYCNENDIHVIIRTGASSSEGQLKVIDDRTVILDGSPMNEIISIDPVNMVATAQCGVPLAVLEAKANELNLTTGHSPQSQPMAYMGGLVATRSTGQFSTYYGSIEDLVCGMEGVLPNGEVFRIRPVPRRAAGPDLRHIVIGAEGTIAFMTEVTVKLFSYYPDEMWRNGYIVKSFDEGMATVREIMVKGYKPSVVRLYDKADVDHNYGSVKLKDEEAFMFFSCEGPGEIAAANGAAIHKICMDNGAEDIGTKAVDHWFIHRNDLCDITGSEMEAKHYRETGIAYATMEICANWEDIGKIYTDAMEYVPNKVPNLTMFGGHVSHSYINGTNIYFVYNIKINDVANADLEYWAVMDAVCDVVLKYPSATIVHHHGVGKARVLRIKEELGTSYPLLRTLKDAFDPKGIMNPGCLLPLEK